MENWKPIKNYEDLYEVSDLGNVRSRNRIVTSKNGQVKNLSGKILKPQKYSNGYLFVSLSRNGNVKGHSLHRLVAIHFIPNSNPSLEVNHIDEDKESNHFRNLEWITHKENMNHGTCLKRRIENSNFKGENNPMFGRKGKLNKKSIPVRVEKVTGEFVGNFYSIKEASDKLGLNSSLCARVYNGFNPHTRGYVIQKQK